MGLWIVSVKNFRLLSNCKRYQMTWSVELFNLIISFCSVQIWLCISIFTSAYPILIMQQLIKSWDVGQTIQVKGLGLLVKVLWWPTLWDAPFFVDIIYEMSLETWYNKPVTSEWRRDCLVLYAIQAKKSWKTNGITNFIWLLAVPPPEILEKQS